MHKALFIATIVLGAAAPCFARAMPPAAPTISGWVIQPGEWMAVGAGVIAGAAAMEILVPTRLIYVLGSVAGGYLASAWYDGRRVEVRSVP